MSRVERIDTGKVYRAYRTWPALAESGFRVEPQLPGRAWRRLFVMGMGGSAAGGDIIAGWVSQRPGAEFSVYKGSVPSVDMSDAVGVACSASGDTAETLAMLETAAENRATIVCISSGGKMRERAQAMGFQHVLMPEPVAPRYMLPFIVFSCLAFANAALGLDCDDDAWASIAAMKAMAKTVDIEAPYSQNGPMRLAGALVKGTPAIFGDAVTRGVGMRFKNALNENAKMHAYFETMPDTFHNEVEAWDGRDEGFIPVFLRHGGENPRDAVRADRLAKLLEGVGSAPLEVRGTGEGLLSQLMTMVYHLDMTSYYAAIALGRDPLPTGLLDSLKKG